MTTFVYSPLDPTTDTIRLLQIEKGARSDRIRCRLFESYPEDQKRGTTYKALSYTWGGPGSELSTEINGHSLEVKENLYSALQEIRRYDLDVTLWVDAICINQNDPDEKTTTK